MYMCMYVLYRIPKVGIWFKSWSISVLSYCLIWYNICKFVPGSLSFTSYNNRCWYVFVFWLRIVAFNSRLPVSHVHMWSTRFITEWLGEPLYARSKSNQTPDSFVDFNELLFQPLFRYWDGQINKRQCNLWKLFDIELRMSFSQ